MEESEVFLAGVTGRGFVAEGEPDQGWWQEARRR